MCEWAVPITGEADALQVRAAPGALTVVVGANGSGKSALGFWMQANSGVAFVERLIAHRRLWIEHAGPDITSGQRDQQSENILNYDRRPDSRWRDHAQAVRPNIALFDLISSHNARNDRLAKQIDAGLSTDEIRTALSPSPIARLNRVLRRCSFRVEVSLAETGSLDAVREGLEPFPISQMSDGEKSALLLAAEILTAKQGSVQIIDEPERHMHRSISAPLMEALADERPDCHFVILTHDLDLAQSLARRNAQILSLQGCEWNGEQVRSWSAFTLNGSEIPDILRGAILGGREHVVFVEGARESLDLKILELLLEGWSIVPAGGCGEVIRATKGLRRSGTFHWIQAAGVVDRDGRTDEECQTLRTEGIYALGMNEIENVYLAAPVIARIAEHQSSVVGEEGADLVARARDAALDALQQPGTVEHLASVSALAIASRKIRESTPDRATLKDAGDEITISLENPIRSAEDRLRSLVTERNLDSILREYSVRDSAVRDRMAVALGFREITHLENVARHLLREDPSLTDELRQIVGPCRAPTPDLTDRHGAHSVSTRPAAVSAASRWWPGRTWP
ncbi:MAG: AAA family ATPase [Acidimicrobiales bacterium]